MKPLQGIRVMEFEGIGPGPLAGRILADMGAEVTVLVRADGGIDAAPAPRFLPLADKRAHAEVT